MNKQKHFLFQIENIKIMINPIELRCLIFSTLIIVSNINSSIQSIDDDENEFFLNLNKLSSSLSISSKRENFEPLSYDGWYHDLNDPDLGSKGSPLKRSATSNYQYLSSISDGLPNVFELSESIFQSNRIHLSQNGKNILAVYFGFFILDEILDTGRPRCPPSYNRIEIPEYFLDEFGNKTERNYPIPHSFMMINKIQHCNHDPLSKMNYRSIWIDGETIYGDSKFCSDLLRTFTNGKLIDFGEDRASFIAAYDECNQNYMSGNLFQRNSFTMSINLVWIRWHNLIAETISSSNPDLSDQIVYDWARIVTISTLQNIIFNEWFAEFFGENLREYRGHLNDLNPKISDLFETISSVYLYSLLPNHAFKIKTECSRGFTSELLRTCNTFTNPFEQLKNEDDLKQILVGLFLQAAQRDDHYIIDDFLFFAKGLNDFTRQNLIAILLQHSRDFSILKYFDARKYLGLDRNESFIPSFEIRKLYNDNPQDIDLIIGSMLENTGDDVGATIKYVFMKQFEMLRDSDRFYFENTANNLIDPDLMNSIKKLKFSSILRLTTRINPKLIPNQVFRLPDNIDNVMSKDCLNSLRKLMKITPCSASRKIERKPNSERCLTLFNFQRSNSLINCNLAETFDYFKGSGVSFLMTLLIIPLFFIILIILLKLMVYVKYSENEKQRIKVSRLRRMTITEDLVLAQEWVGPREGFRNIILKLDAKSKSITIRMQYENRIVRKIFMKDVVGRVNVEISSNKSQNFLLIRVPKEYDIVLKFDSYYEREKFLTQLESFLSELHFAIGRSSKELRSMLRTASTKAKRQKHLEKFFRVVFSQAFNKKSDEINNLDMKTAKEIIETELTQFEFAEVLSMRPESTFVQQMFNLIDKDLNGYISFREFLDVIIIFAKGSAEQKIKIMFDMYDVNQIGRLSIDDFKTMIKSLLEIANQSVSPKEMNQTIHSMLSENGLTSKKELTFEDFSKLFHNYKDELGYTELNFDLSSYEQSQLKTKRQSKLFRANETFGRAYSYFGGTDGTNFASPMIQSPSQLKIETQEHKKNPAWYIEWICLLDSKKKETFFMILYNLIVAIIFFDKFYYYAYLNEHSGLRQIAGWGVPLTRASASALMFGYATLLLTMCRNLITLIRESFLHRYIAFDGSVTLHKYIAYMAMVMAILHSIGHLSNFYHISTQRPQDINCVFCEIYFLKDQLPKFHDYCFRTLTGLTGIFLLILLLVIYVFAVPYSRRHIFNAFWATHNLYPFFYGLMILHGLGRLIQPPIFSFYLGIPLILFTIDKLISASRKKIEISVIKATLHPSNVTHLEFKKPPNFDYKSGQWLRIACLGLNRNEYHPFTIASAPHEKTLSLYIRAVGPFTKNIRQIYDHNLLNGRPYPKLYLDGPYGEGHQDWFRFDVSILIGGGIGITPFASIIKDITFRSSINSKVNCKKVYFLWVTRTQKHFEWMSDVIREAEENDHNNLLVTHIFITQFYEKFDLRTTMLYICERHFQRISNKSLFTGLKAKTHFGRPNFNVFFESLQQEHRDVERVGVFSCGPNPMTNSVQQACDRMNRKEGIIFKHHFENF
ncbi:Dual oxidase 2 [Sarcoptes scabiei]|uniref:NAD(P)H oxidase (H2O2-forming) n=1 Tax=Sarcoptes scabiei TaxID=52283 RepID=A0A834R4C2_SARSC|nr:Dual oxidase 2 [Sarcoptes scabiei]